LRVRGAISAAPFSLSERSMIMALRENVMGVPQQASIAAPLPPNPNQRTIPHVTLPPSIPVGASSMVTPTPMSTGLSFGANPAVQAAFDKGRTNMAVSASTALATAPSPTMAVVEEVAPLALGAAAAFYAKSVLGYAMGGVLAAGAGGAVLGYLGVKYVWPKL